jgi:hypothetical protein
MQIKHDIEVSHLIPKKNTKILQISIMKLGRFSLVFKITLVHMIDKTRVKRN